MSEIDLENSVLVDPHVAAQLVGLSYGTLANWRMHKKGPPYYTIGRKVRYRVEDLNEWLDNRRNSCDATA